MKKNLLLAFCGVVAIAGALLVFWPATELAPPPEPMRQSANDGKIFGVYVPPDRTESHSDSAHQEVHSLLCANSQYSERKVSATELEVAKAAALEQMSRRLSGKNDGSQSLDARSQAIAAYFKAQSTQILATQEYLTERNKCGGNEDCFKAVDYKLQSTRSGAIAPILRSAITTSDPEIYAMAYAQCYAQQAGEPPPACSQITASQWLRVAPESLEAKVAVAREAAMRGSPDAVYALEAVAKHSSSLKVAIPSYVQAMYKVGDGQDEQSDLASLGILGPYAQLSPEIVMSEACGTRAARSVDEAQVCQTLMQRMISERNSLSQLKASFKVARVMGWDKDKTEALRLDIKQINRAVTRATITPGATCGTIAAYERIAKSVMQGTEMSLYPQLIAEAVIAQK